MATEISKLFACALLVLAPALAGCDGEGGTTAPSDASTYADLGITLTNLDDDDITLVSKTKDNVHVLAFWATWCVPCTGELSKMQGVYDRLHERGLEVYAISIDGPDTISRVPGFASQYNWTFPVLFDPETRVLASYNPKGDLPFYVVLDADGNILKSHQGYVKGDIAKLEQFLTEQLPAE
jgi:peroxiredoxin